MGEIHSHLCGYPDTQNKMFRLLWRKDSTNSDAFLAGWYAPAAVAFPSWDSDVVPVREIIQYPARVQTVASQCARPPTGEWCARRGVPVLWIGFSCEN